MTRVILAVLALVLSAGSATAQVCFGPAPVYGFKYKQGFAAGFGTGHFSVRGFTAAAYVPPPVGFVPFGGFAWGPTTVVVVPQPVPVPFQFPAGIDITRGDEIPLEKKRDFVVIRPRRDRDAVAVEVAPPPVRRPPFVPDPPAGKPDPDAEAARQVTSAKEAFAAGRYGVAAERLAEAVRVKPGDALPHFLLGQVRFARGEYAEAVAAIRDGLTRAPDWPAATFRPKELYGANPDRFDAHLGDLRAAAAANPADPTPGFLLGYQLWFTGRKAEAAWLFRDAAKNARDGKVIAAFAAAGP